MQKILLIAMLLALPTHIFAVDSAVESVLDSVESNTPCSKALPGRGDDQDLPGSLTVKIKKKGSVGSLPLVAVEEYRAYKENSPKIHRSLVTHFIATEDPQVVSCDALGESLFRHFIIRTTKLIPRG